MKQPSRDDLRKTIKSTLTSESISKEIIDCKIKVRFKDVDLVREVCKLPQVRKRFTVSRSNGSPFWDAQGSELNPLQIRILTWIKFYDNIDESMDRPPDRIVYNDKLLGKWLEAQREKMDDRYEENWQGSTSKVSKSALDHQVIFEFEDDGTSADFIDTTDPDDI